MEVITMNSVILFSDTEWEEKKNTAKLKRATPSLTLTFPELSFAYAPPLLFVLLCPVNVY